MTRNGHTHRCKCGTLLSCAYDRCAAEGPTFICRACELDMMDDYINQLQTRKLDTQKDTQPHEPKQSR